MKVAIVHDWLIGGGAERVVYELHHMYPEAPIYTSYCSDEWRQKLDGKVVTGYLQRWPFGKLRKFLPVLRMQWFQSLDLKDYDMVISSSGNGEAKHVRAGSTFRQGQVHINYCHSPVHFYWRHYDNYLRNPGFGALNPLARLGLRLLVSPLRKRDYQAAQHVDHFIANSTHIQNDIQAYYGRDSTVIHPPVDVERFASAPSGERKGLVTVGRLVPNKRVDLIVAACTRLNLPLAVVGRGPELANLQKIAGPTVTFDTGASDEEVVRYMASAEAFLFASHEDFGITPVEAMAAGTPVIAYRAGGALDYVIDGQTGLFFADQTVQSFCEALQNFPNHSFNQAVIKQQSQAFSIDNFHQKMQSAVAAALPK